MNGTEFGRIPREKVVDGQIGFLCADHFVADRVMNKICYRMQIQLEHDIGAMRLCGFDAYAQRLGNFFVGLALGEQLGDFAFAWSEKAS